MHYAATENAPTKLFNAAQLWLTARLRNDAMRYANQLCLIHDINPQNIFVIEARNRLARGAVNASEVRGVGEGECPGPSAGRQMQQ